eukprot:UN11700
MFTVLEKEIVYYKDSHVVIFGKKMAIPRKQMAMGDPGTAYKFSGVELGTKPWSPLMLKLKTKVEEAAKVKFNFVLVNRYEDGQQNIGEHRDDERDLDPKGMIAGLSFGQNHR